MRNIKSFKIHANLPKLGLKAVFLRAEPSPSALVDIIVVLYSKYFDFPRCNSRRSVGDAEKVTMELRPLIHVISENIHNLAGTSACNKQF